MRETVSEVLSQQRQTILAELGIALLVLPSHLRQSSRRMIAHTPY
jgi:hypothetical protein